jgi:hypothetical protein
MTKVIKRNISEVKNNSAFDQIISGSTGSELQRIAAGTTNQALLDKVLYKDDLTRAYELLNRTIQSKAFKNTVFGLEQSIRQSDYFKVYKGINELLHSSQAQDAFRKYISTIDSFINQHSETIQAAQKLSQQLHNSSVGSLLQKLMDSDLSYAYSQLKLLNSASSILEGAELENEDIFDQQINGIIEQLDHSESKLKEGTLSVSEAKWNIDRLLIIIGILLPLIMGLIQSSQDQKQHEQLIHAIERQSVLFSAFMRMYHEESINSTIYEVKRHVPLSSEQSFHNHILTWLIPHQEVKVLDYDGKWIKVEAYDISSSETHIGWVLKKYLNRKENSQSSHVMPIEDEIDL